MLAVCLLIVAIRVALRKESVDRNIMPDSSAPGAGGRSPQGERG